MPATDTFTLLTQKTGENKLPERVANNKEGDVSVGSLAYEEVADICCVAVGTIKSRVSRARAMLSQTIASGQMVDFRHNFVLGGEAIDAFFEELMRIGNMNADVVEIAA